MRFVIWCKLGFRAVEGPGCVETLYHMDHVQRCAESENHHFSHNIYFLNMDISLIIAFICLKTCMYICSEGRVSQKFDIGLSFCFIVCRR